MPRVSPRRARSPYARVSISLCLLSAMSATAALAQSQKPGAVLRLYSIDQAITGVPQLMDGQRPNVARIVDTIDFEGAGFAPLSDNFVTRVDAWLRAPEKGAYGFRLISDDGSRLWVNNDVAIDHDGPHGPTPMDGVVELNAGSNLLRIDHFELGGGERLTLLWKPPGASDFSPIPAKALWHDDAESLATAEGVKRIVPPLRRGRPGDGAPVAGPHPGVSLGEATPGRMSTDAGRGVVYGESGARLTPSPRGRYQPTALLRVTGDESGKSTVVGWLPPDEATYLGVNVVPLADSGQYVFQNVSERALYRMSVAGPEQAPNVCVFRHSANLPIEPYLLTSTPDGVLTIASAGPDGRSLQIKPTGKTAFEIAEVAVLSNGLELRFTEPLDPRVGWEADQYQIEQWKLSGADPAPRRDGEWTPVRSASVSEDRTRVFLETDALTQGAVIYVRLWPPILSEQGDLPWSTEAWLTINTVPSGRYGVIRTPPRGEPQNVLTAAEKAAGWRLLFDGRTLDGWRGFKKPEPGAGWQVIDGCLVRAGPAGDLITTGVFDDFELTLEWRVVPGGNSGVFFNVDEQSDYVWQTGPEMQILDNTEHHDGKNTLTSAGANYALHQAVRDATRPIGLFNEARLLVRGNQVTHWLNGVKLLEYELKSDDWKRRVAESKFASMPRYGTLDAGHIALQDHGDRVWFRNVKIREAPGAE